MLLVLQWLNVNWLPRASKCDYKGTNACCQFFSGPCKFVSPQPERPGCGLQQGECTVKLDERSIYPNLKLTIYKTGIRQNRLAKLVGIHEAYLSRIVNGSREPGDALRQAIASALHSEPEWLFEREKVLVFPSMLHQDRQAS